MFGPVFSLLVILLFFGTFLWTVFRVAPALLAPPIWLARLVAASFGQPTIGPSRRLLDAGRHADRTLFDELALTPRALGAQEYEVFRDGFRVVVRLQAGVVRANGTPAGFPWTAQDRSESEPVRESWIVVDARDRLSNLPQIQIQLGDEDVIFGMEALAAGILDDPLRSKLGKGDCLVIDRGLICLASPFAVRAGRLGLALEALIELTKRIARASYKDGRIDVPGLMLEAFERSRIPRTKATIVDRVLSSYSGTEAAKRITELAIADEAPQVRFAAARVLGAEGLPMVIEVLDAKAAPDGLRQRALRHYLSVATPDEAEPLITRILVDGREELRRVVLQHLRELRRPIDLERLLGLEPLVAGDTAIELARSLGELGEVSAEGVLIKLYQRADPPLMIAAADALATAGTPSALPMLLPASKGGNPELRMAASTAVNLIRSRYASSGAGSLSIPDAQATPSGALSHPVAEAGALSAPKAEDPPDS